MANTLSKSGISTTQTIEAWHVTQSVDAFTGTKLYNISISGSLNMTGSINTPPGTINNATASYSITASHALNAADSLFTATGISGSLGSNASLIRSLTSTGISGSWQAQTSSMTVATASYANQLYGSPSIVVNHITASGNISSSGAYYGDGSNLTGITSINTGSLGNTVITGSLTVSGSNTFKNIGPAEFIGDVTITGSLMVSGSNNKLDLTLGKNIFIGPEAGEDQTDNRDSIFLGNRAGFTNSTGQNNTAIGRGAGGGIGTAGSDGNVFVGNLAGAGNASIGSITARMSNADNNVGIGYQALLYLTSGDSNVAIGRSAMRGSGAAMSAGNNIALGEISLYKTDSGNHNIGIGYYSGYNQTSGTGNITVGSGSKVIAAESNQLRIGNGEDITTISASLATGDIIFPSSASFTGLPTSEPEITGSLWISGSSVAHPKSGYLMVFNP